MFFSRWLNVTDDEDIGIKVPEPVKFLMKHLTQDQHGIDLVAFNKAQAYKLTEIVNYFGHARYGQPGWRDGNITLPTDPEGEELERLILQIKKDRVFELDGRICDPAVLSQKAEDVPQPTNDIEYLQLEDVLDLGQPLMASTPEPMENEEEGAIGGAVPGSQDEVLAAEEKPKETSDIDWQQVGLALLSDPDAMAHIYRILAQTKGKKNEEPSK